MKKKVFGILLVAILQFGLAAALADAISVDGKVTADTAVEVYAPIGGMVDHIAVKAGQAVSEGEALLSLRTTKIYADADGKISGIFCEPGDAVDTVVDRYGALLYLETDSLYTISASTEQAYSSTDTKTIHVGETVYVRASSTRERNGKARVTAVSGTKFTAEILTGGFITGEKAYVYRDEKFSRTQRLGYGEVSRTAPVAVTGKSSGSTTTAYSSTNSNQTLNQNGTTNSGGSNSSTTTNSTYSVVRIAVTEGQVVKRGDLLAELLLGKFDGLYMSGADIVAPETGTVSEIAVSEGTTIAKDAVVAKLYTRDAMCVTAEIPEENLRDIAVGSRMRIKLTTDESQEYEGTVRLISGVATTNSDPVTFTAWIDFTPDDAVRYGSTVIVETKE